MERESLFAGGEWPRCFYEPKLLCGERETRIARQATDEDVDIVRRGWHVADMCDCPSCPLRVAISAAVHREKA